MRHLDGVGRWPDWSFSRTLGPQWLGRPGLWLSALRLPALRVSGFWLPIVWLLLAMSIARPVSGADAPPAGASAAPPAAVQTAAAVPQVIVADLHGAVSPASAAFFLRALGEARGRGAALLVIRLDTPGGLDTSMREMIQAMLASPVPVAIFVAPGGARAASAGTYLMYAAHVAAMAPGTNLGAATPVQVGIGGEKGRPAGSEKEAGRDTERNKPPADGSKDGEGRAAPPADVSAAKATQDAAAYLRSLAQLRGRDAEWAERAVRDAASLSAQEALARKVIDLIADDVPDLLAQLEGRSVSLPDGSRMLALAGAQTTVLVMNWKEEWLARIADPNLALILLMLGVYGLLFEFYSPGMGVPGVVGGICLLLGLYGLALLPVNFAGVALLLLGIALMVAEAFLPSFGVVGIGGVVAFIAGALMLVDADVPGLTVTWQVVVPLAVLSGALIAAIAAFALRARRRPTVAGREAMLGAPVVAIDAFVRAGDEGWVLAWGERWRARSRAALAAGGRGRVVAVVGLMLEVAADGAATESAAADRADHGRQGAQGERS